MQIQMKILMQIGIIRLTIKYKFEQEHKKVEIQIQISEGSSAE